MLGIKDLDFYLGSFLDTQSIFNLSHLNSNSLKVYNDNYFRNRFLKLHPKSLLPEKFGKREYFLSIWNLYNPEYIIGNDLDYLIELAEMTNEIGAVVTADAIKCFKIVWPYHEYSAYYIDLAIRAKSVKIVKYLYSINRLIFSDHYLLDALTTNFKEYLELFPTIIDETVEYIFYRLCYSEQAFCQKWTNNYNSAFHVFIKKISPEILEKTRLLCLSRGRHHVVKLITVYISRFSEFSRK